MAVIPLTKPYSLKAAQLVIGSDNFEAAVTGVQFDPTNSPTVARFINGGIYKDAAVPDWTATVGLAQDLAAGSLTRYLLANSGLTKSCVFTPIAGGAEAVSASLIILPGSLGGIADGNLAMASVQLPVIGTPVLAASPAAVPTILSVLPSGAAAGAQVVIRGTGFTGTIAVTGVKFGGVNASAWQVVDDFTIVAVLPAGSAGSAPVIVTNAIGASTAFAYTRA